MEDELSNIPEEPVAPVHVAGENTGSELHRNITGENIGPPSVTSTPQKQTGASQTRMQTSQSKIHTSTSKVQVSSSKIQMTPSKMQMSRLQESPSRTITSQSRLSLTQSKLILSAPKDDESKRSSLMSRRKYSSIDKRGSTARRRSGTLTGSILSIRRHSVEAQGKVVKMQNTYRLESKYPFNRDRVSMIMKEVVEKECVNERYDPLKSPRLAMFLTAEIRARIKFQHYDRYKIVVFVTVCEKQQQSVHSVMRFLWDPEKDSYVFHNFENSTMFIVACVYGLYYE